MKWIKSALRRRYLEEKVAPKVHFKGRAFMRNLCILGSNASLTLLHDYKDVHERVCYDDVTGMRQDYLSSKFTCFIGLPRSTIILRGQTQIMALLLKWTSFAERKL